MESGQCAPDSRADVADHPSAAVVLSGKLDAESGILDEKLRLSCILSGKLDTVRMVDSAPRSSYLFTIP